MDPELWDAYAAKFGRGTAVQKLGPRPSAPPTEVSPEQAALARLNARGGSAGGDFLRLAAQGATLRFSDELMGVGAALVPGGKGYREARDAERQRLADLRLLNPGASGAAELAGGLLIPTPGKVTAGRAAMRGAGQAVSGGVRAGAVQGAKVGAPLGGLLALGGAEGTVEEQLRATAGGAALGAVGGGVLGGGVAAAGRMGRAAHGPAEMDDVAQTFAQRAGVPGGDVGGMVEAAKSVRKAVSASAYKPLEELGEIADPEVLAVLQTPRIVQAARKVMGKEASARAPTFLELQATEKTLRGLRNAAQRSGRTDLVDDYGKALDTLSDVMRRRVPGYAEAQAAYGQARAAEKAFALGEKLWNKPAHLVKRELDKLPTDIARENARAAMAARFYDKLATKGGKITASMVAQFEALGMTARIRQMFKDPADADAFLRQIEKNGQAIADRAKLVTGAKFLAAVSGIGAAGGLTLSLLD